MNTWTDILHICRTGNSIAPTRVEKSDSEWRATLAPEVYDVLRNKGTERPFSSEMCGLFAPGVYDCAGCGTLLFNAQTKFDSGTGWPSFTEPASPTVVAYHGDRSHGRERVEVTCNVCDGHLGHVFPDGPPPSGLRYCINALALKIKK